LVPGARAKQTERNYFMISKNYCCLTSRLGYHFSTVETLVTDRAPENYAVFRFQGGAADDDRRGRRVRLIADILEGRGFIADIRGDNLAARIQGLPEGEMYEALWVLGYLSIHTRQIDMVMSSNADIGRYANKLQQDMADALQKAEPL
jgi:pyruvate,water dikinase